MKLAEVVALLRGQALEDDKLTVDEILEIFRSRVYGPLLLLPAVIAIFPVIGALPGVSLAMALIMLLGSVQLAAGLRRPWLPRRLKNIAVSGHRARAVLDALEPWAARFDRLLRPRLQFLFDRPGIHLTGALCVAVALLALIGALAPALIVPPALVMILIAFALIASDGALLIVAGALAAGIAWLLWHAARRIDWGAWLPLPG